MLIFDTINFMETLLTRPAIETPGTIDMAGFEAAFAAPDAVPTPEVVATEAAVPQFNMELVGMFMRAHGNAELSNMLAGIIAADMLTKNALYQQEQAAKAAVQQRGDDYRAFVAIHESNDKKDEKVAA